MTDKEYLNFIQKTLHDFCGSKVHLILEDNYIDPRDDLRDAMSLISCLLTDLDTHIQIQREDNAKNI